MAKLKEYMEPAIKFPKTEPKPSTPKEPEPKIEPSTPMSPGGMSPAPKPKTKIVEDPKVSRDEQGNITRLELPDGRSFSGLKPGEYLRLLEAYKGSSPAIARMPITAQEQFQAQANLEQSKQEFALNQIPQAPTVQPELTPQEVQSTAGFSNEINPQTILNTDENARKLYFDTLNNAAAREGTNGAVKITDTIYDLLPGGQYKKALIKNLVTNPDRRDFLSGYSNEDNMDAIIRDLEFTNKDIETAKTLAAIPGYSKQARETYQTAQAKKVLLYTQLKRLSQADQRAYTTKAKDKMVEIENYWATYKTQDDFEITSTLSKVNQ